MDEKTVFQNTRCSTRSSKINKLAYFIRHIRMQLYVIYIVGWRFVLRFQVISQKHALVVKDFTFSLRTDL